MIAHCGFDFQERLALGVCPVASRPKSTDVYQAVLSMAQCDPGVKMLSQTDIAAEDELKKLPIANLELGVVGFIRTSYDIMRVRRVY